MRFIVLLTEQKKSVLYADSDTVRLRPSSAAKTFAGYLWNSV